MAKDYFQDIVPPSGSPKQETPQKSDGARSIPIRTEEAPPQAERSIRNISVPERPRPRAMPDMREVPPSNPAPRPAGKRSRWWLWLAAALCILALATLLLVALRNTRVSVTPRALDVAFDSSRSFIASPGGSATGTLAYTVVTTTLEDSEPVAAQGTVHAEDKASGTITVFNETASQLRLVKTTRFQTPDGLVYRAPNEVVVPPKRGATPGQASVTVLADKAGETYNVGPIEKFTLPGLKNSRDFELVYARSSAAFTGGFIGERPAVAPADMQAALATVRNRLEGRARQGAAELAPAGSIALPGLIQISYQELPSTTDTDGARVRQQALVSIPVFDSAQFAAAVAEGTSADAEGSSVRLVQGEGFASALTATSTLGTDPLRFALEGSATFIWDIDTEALAAALANKDEDSFEAIAANFPGIEEAKAHIQPFWKRTFPADPADIHITVEEPKKGE